jgi:hypothetical protein
MKIENPASCEIRSVIKFLNAKNRILTGDETWIPHVTPENKQQSMQWRHCASPKAKKFNRHFLPGRSCVPCALGQMWCFVH